jgi:hypothetical protein
MTERRLSRPEDRLRSPPDLAFPRPDGRGSTSPLAHHSLRAEVSAGGGRRP